MTRQAGAESAKAAPVAAEEGFTYLFNGKDFTGWVYGKAKKRTGRRREQGRRRATGSRTAAGHLLDRQGRRQPLHREGVRRLRPPLRVQADREREQRHRHPAPLSGDAAYAGMEIQVLDDSGSAYKGKLQPDQYHGSIYDVVAAKRGSQKPVGEWNTEEITADGPANQGEA